MQLQEKFNSPPPLAYASCSAEKDENDEIVFYVFYGESLSETPQNGVYRYNYTRTT